MLYACDAKWWDCSGPQIGEFYGQRWSSHNETRRKNDNKQAAAATHGLNLVNGEDGDGFCFDLGRIHYGDNSGFQAINLALQFGCERIFLIGFDMSHSGKRHFFGDHPKACAKDSNYRHFIGYFDNAARLLPGGIEIINCTPGSALRCFPRGEI